MEALDWVVAGAGLIAALLLLYRLFADRPTTGEE
jgi:hypothetical protein